ncbi:MAG: glycosyltransferase family 2 protein [Deltaproteobacteria bacterium]|nr:glycosyltransferase family 2 protein [Deltaproteobacteria bacterium]
MSGKEDKSDVTVSGVFSTPSLSVIIPVYNEESYIGKVIEKVLSLDSNIEIVAVNDGSADNTGRILDRFSEQYPDRVKVIHCPTNLGKGSAIRTGIGHVRGEVVIIQDADLEYDPEDILKVIKPIRDGKASVVYGSRVLAQNPRFKNSYYWGGRFLSIATNLLYGTHITDEPTCYSISNS